MNNNSYEYTIRKKHGLTVKQYFFCKYYVSNGHNGADAARRAGYKGNNHQLSVIADQNLAKLGIKAFIEEIEQPILEKLEVDEDWVLSKLKNFANAKITDYFDIKDNKMILKDLSKMDENKISSIEYIKETKSGIEIKLVDKRSSLLEIGKHLGMFKNQVSPEANNNNTPRVYIIPSFRSQSGSN